MSQTGESTRALLQLMARLRGEGGCPWDREQTHASLRPFLIEEAYELLEAIDRGEPARLQDELGDMLLQVIFHARIAEEAGHFGFDEVASHLSSKLIRRHPHVFGDAVARDAQEVKETWEEVKRNEGAGAPCASLLDSIPRGLPALLRAQRLQEKAASVGFDWPEAGGALEKVREELEELEALFREEPPDPQELRDELGDLLFSVVNVARKLDLSAEDALRAASGRFTSRFACIEEQVAAQQRGLQEMTLEELDALWEVAKERESRS